MGVPENRFHSMIIQAVKVKGPQLEHGVYLQEHYTLVAAVAAVIIDIPQEIHLAVQVVQVVEVPEELVVKESKAAIIMSIIMVVMVLQVLLIQEAAVVAVGILMLLTLGMESVVKVVLASY